ncbi:early nodulin-like protein 2 [Phalaenopsis equestris]|uniref:early nodulin-like protein 2 n=1 Tax=Phalaenopsis equestris TaxID=78828 RepID=UPI0009E237E5|nr:early nodulin-like protein 2 [Phalaenopsis equestris]
MAARLLLLAGFFLCSVYFTEAYDFYVGGRNGWVRKPAEKYNSWAERMRFQVKDKLIFNYKKGEDSVLIVDKEDYDSCNTKNPIKRFEDGKTVFVFDRSGPFFFISGADGHCAQGQKLIVVVMAVRHKPVQPPPSSPITPAPSPAPGAKPPSSSTPSKAPSPAPAIEPPSSSLSPAPAVKPPTSSPSPAPAAETPTSSLSPAPEIATPSSSPSQAPEIATPTSSPSASPSSFSSPTTSPVPSQAKSPSPTSASPVAPADGPGASGFQPPPSSPAPGGSGGDSGGVPAALTPSSNSTSTPTPSSAQILSVSRLSVGIFTLFLGSIVLL